MTKGQGLVMLILGGIVVAHRGLSKVYEIRHLYVIESEEQVQSTGKVQWI